MVHSCHLKEFSLTRWLVWLSGLIEGLQTKGSQVQFPVRAHAWVVGQVPSRWRCEIQPHIDVSLSFFLLPFPSLFKKNKNSESQKNQGSEQREQCQGRALHSHTVCVCDRRMNRGSSLRAELACPPPLRARARAHTHTHTHTVSLK